MKHILIITPLLLALTFGASAQEQLSQEITVDHEVVPERRDVNKIYFTPSSTLPKVDHIKLPYSNRTVSVTVPGTITTLDPAAYADTLQTESWRGYVAGGYFPLANFGATAGYKFIDNDHTRLAAFMQYNGINYRGKFPTQQSPHHYFRSNTATIDLTLHQAVGRKSFIDIGAGMTMARYNMPAGGDSLRNQNMRRANIMASFSSSIDTATTYFATLTFDNFSYANTILTTLDPRETYKPVHENLFALNGGFTHHISQTSALGADLNASIVANNRRSDAFFSLLANQYIFTPSGSYTHGLVSLKPFYRFDIRNFHLNLGARLEFTFNSGKAVHIAPDAVASWRPSKILAVSVRAGGGEHQNTLASLYGVSPYAQTFLAYENSHIPLTLGADVTLGTWRGAYLSAGVDYARANSWAMPVTDSNLLTIFKPIDMRGMHWRVEAGYDWRSIAAAKVSIEGAPQGYEKGYYLWRDRAKTVLRAQIKANPIKPLTITADFEMRSGRAMINYVGSDDPLVAPYYSHFSLGNTAELSLGAAYKFTHRLSFFASLQNILNRHYSHIGLVPSQGMAGLLGATYKF